MSSASPAVTIGVPFRNPGRYFELALKSIFAQTFTDWELILVDDGSTDGSLQLAQSLDDPRVRVIADGRHMNLNYRLNQITALARGKFFVRMDADDVMRPNRIQTQVDFLRGAESNTVVGSACYSIDEHSTVVGWRRAPKQQRKGFAARHSFVHPTVCARTEWFRSNKYSESIVFHRSEDAELWCRTSDSTRFVVLPEPLLFYRELGTFSYQNYLGTSMGVLFLVREYSKGPLEYLYLISRECLKCWVSSVVSNIGEFKHLVKIRYKRVAEGERLAAEGVLDTIRQQTLPIRQAVLERACQPVSAG